MTIDRARKIKVVNENHSNVHFAKNFPYASHFTISRLCLLETYNHLMIQNSFKYDFSKNHTIRTHTKKCLHLGPKPRDRVTCSCDFPGK